MSLLSVPGPNRWLDTFDEIPAPDLSRRDALVFQLKRDLIAIAEVDLESQRAFLQERIDRIREELS
jgi:hypothetical protein